MKRKRSHPVRGAWIEIISDLVSRIEALESHPVRGAWIEILSKVAEWYLRVLSHPVRGAWIEIIYARSKELVETGRIP